MFVQLHPLARTLATNPAPSQWKFPPHPGVSTWPTSRRITVDVWGAHVSTSSRNLRHAWAWGQQASRAMALRRFGLVVLHAMHARWDGMPCIYNDCVNAGMALLVWKHGRASLTGGAYALGLVHPSGAVCAESRALMSMLRATQWPSVGQPLHRCDKEAAMLTCFLFIWHFPAAAGKPV